MLQWCLFDNMTQLFIGSSLTDIRVVGLLQAPRSEGSNREREEEVQSPA